MLFHYMFSRAICSPGVVLLWVRGGGGVDVVVCVCMFKHVHVCTHVILCMTVPCILYPTTLFLSMYLFPYSSPPSPSNFYLILIAADVLKCQLMDWQQPNTRGKGV